MTALAADRIDNLTSGRDLINMPNAAASVHIYYGAMVSLDTSGNCRPARATASDKVLGVCAKSADNSSGSAGAFSGGIDIDRGRTACMKNSGSSITSAHVGRDCFVVDDQTVALTSNAGARPRAGRIFAVTDDGVFVDFQAEPNKVATVKVSITDVSAASDSTIEYAPFAGVIREVWSVLGGAITVADATVTPKIGSTAITGGELTIAYTSSAAGDLDSAHPTAANIVSKGSKLIASTDGGSTDTQTLQVYFEIEAL